MARQAEKQERCDDYTELKNNQQRILDWMRSGEADVFSRSDLIKTFGLPPRTIEEAVKRLLKHKFLERLGAGRATRYRHLRAANSQKDP